MTEDPAKPESEIGSGSGTEVSSTAARQAGGAVLALGATALVVWWLLVSFLHLNVTILAVGGGLGVLLGLWLLVTGNRQLK